MEPMRQVVQMDVPISKIYLKEPKDKMRSLLSMIGNLSECKACKEFIYWAITKAGKKMPLNCDGTPHWATCPAAANFRRKDNPKK